MEFIPLVSKPRYKGLRLTRRFGQSVFVSGRGLITFDRYEDERSTVRVLTRDLEGGELCMESQPANLRLRILYQFVDFPARIIIDSVNPETVNVFLNALQHVKFFRAEELDWI